MRGSLPGRGFRLVCAAALLCGIEACGNGDGDSAPSSPPFVAVLSAFPAELAAVLEHVEVTETVTINGRGFRVGTINGVRVVAGMTGIGLVNAATTTQAVLDRLPVTGVVVSGVGGSSYRIGDVAVPETWELAEGGVYAAEPTWIRLARALAGPESDFQQCTDVRMGADERHVCLDFHPEVVVGGVGRSSDTFGNMPFPCHPNGGDVFGCDVTMTAAVFAPSGDDTPIEADNETAAIAREADARGLPFIAFRATSDGAGDPLGLPGYPVQFFAYYKLAAHNAAAAAAAFLERLGGGHRVQASAAALAAPA